MSDVWIAIIDKYGYPIFTSIAIGFFFYKFWQSRENKDVELRNKEEECRKEEKQYFIDEIGKQRDLFTETINIQSKTFKETVDSFNLQLTKLSENLVMNNEKLHNVEEDIKKVKDDVNEIKYTIKARD